MRKIDLNMLWANVATPVGQLVKWNNKWMTNPRTKVKRRTLTWRKVMVWLWYHIPKASPRGFSGYSKSITSLLPWGLIILWKITLFTQKTSVKQLKLVTAFMRSRAKTVTKILCGWNRQSFWNAVKGAHERRWKGKQQEVLAG